MKPYPAQYESDVVVKDGSTLYLRPMKTADEGAVLDFFRRLTPESLHYRFFTTPRLDLSTASYLTDIDYENRFALVGETGGHVVAAAHYYRNEDAPDRAEVAFAIADVLQGRGIGTRMLEQLAVAARGNGIAWFDAYVLCGNSRMLDVFVNSGYEVQQRLEGGVFHVVLSLESTAAFEEKATYRSRQAAVASMNVFFEPKVVAVVGAARRRGQIGSEIFHNLRATGFCGTVIPVNPNATSVDGVKTYARVMDVPTDVDLAVVVVSADNVMSAVDDCLSKGVRGLVVISAGFSEVGAEGRRREAMLLDSVRNAGIRMIGPNCMGLLNTAADVRLNATFSPSYPPAGRVAMSTQSGALGLAILDYARRLNIGFSTFVSVGNQADVSSNDLIQYWAEDPNTDVILLYVESFGDPAQFSTIARSVCRQKPIVAVKAGRSRAGARAASSHTGALATSDAVVDALFRQTGVMRTDTLEELFDVAALAGHQPVPKGRRVAILTNAGGPGILAADACEARGLELPPLSDTTVTELRSFLPAAASVANPVDMLASAPAEHYRRAMRLMLNDANIDSLLVIFVPPLVTDPVAVAGVVVETTRESHGKPVLATFMSAQGAPPMLAPIPCYVFPESAATALARYAAYGEWRSRPPGSVPHFADVDRAAARAITASVLERGGGWVLPGEAQQLLGVFGIPVAKALTAASLSDTLAAAREIGFPVAIKAIGPTILHKTDVGGVKLNLMDVGAAEDAYHDLSRRLGSAMTLALVQQMVPGGVEVMIGTHYDQTFGPLVLYGSGGTLVEVLADVAFRIHPLADRDAAEMLEQVKGTALLRGYRGTPRADETALRETILRVSALLEACPEVQEMDINPLKVLEKGVVAVDVRLRVEPRPARPVSRRISY